MCVVSILFVQDSGNTSLKKKYLGRKYEQVLQTALKVINFNSFIPKYIDVYIIY